MTRTFQTHTSRGQIVFCLLPVVFLAGYFFWIKLAIPAFLFLIISTLVLERIIHSQYIINDSGNLIIYKGRLARQQVVSLQRIVGVELHATPRMFLFFRNEEVVELTLDNGSRLLLNPVSPAEFCHLILKKQKELCSES